MTRLWTHISRTLDTRERREISLVFDTLVWSPDLWISVMLEIFQSSGIRQDFRERLNSVVKAGEMDSAVPLSI